MKAVSVAVRSTSPLKRNICAIELLTYVVLQLMIYVLHIVGSNISMSGLC